MDVDSMAVAAWENSEKKGWHDRERTVGDQLALIHSEVSEALEAYRTEGLSPWASGMGKPEGFMAELADVVIRIGDLAQDLRRQDPRIPTLGAAIAEKMAYNTTRPYRHGNKAL